MSALGVSTGSDQPIQSTRRRSSMEQSTRRSSQRSLARQKRLEHRISSIGPSDANSLTRKSSLNVSEQNVSRKNSRNDSVHTLASRRKSTGRKLSRGSRKLENSQEVENHSELVI